MRILPFRRAARCCNTVFSLFVYYADGKRVVRRGCATVSEAASVSGYLERLMAATADRLQNAHDT